MAEQAIALSCAVLAASMSGVRLALLLVLSLLRFLAAVRAFRK
jgi:hypothetical protein